MDSQSPAAPVGFLITQVARLYALQMANELAPLGLATAQFAVLVHLWESEGKTQKQLADCIGVEQATMARTLARMERDGLVVRTPHPGDGRARIVRATAHAAALRAPALTVSARVDRQLVAPLAGTERAALIPTLERIVAGQLGEPQDPK